MAHPNYIVAAEQIASALVRSIRGVGATVFGGYLPATVNHFGLAISPPAPRATAQASLGRGPTRNLGARSISPARDAMLQRRSHVDGFDDDGIGIAGSA